MNNTIIPAFNTWRLLDSARSVIGRLRNLELAKIGLSPEQSSILQMIQKRWQVHLETTFNFRDPPASLCI